MNIPLTPQQIQSFPKIDLHCHLDGSVPLQIFQNMPRFSALALSDEEESLLAQVQAPVRCTNLTEYLSTFTLALEILQSPKILWQAVYALMEDLAEENVIYAELRFSPLSLCSEKMSAEEAVEIVLDAIRQGEEDTGVRAQLLLCMMRHQSDSENHKVLELAAHYHDAGVAGVDIAGDETSFPTHRFASLLEKAAEKELPFTLHAGECGNPENVRSAMELGAKRIGHGIAAIQDTALCRQLAQNQVLLETCPVSNLQTGAVSCWDEYPLEAFLRLGVPVSVNTDNRTVSNTSLTREYCALAENGFPLTADTIQTLTLSALEGAFLPAEEKETFRQTILESAPHLLL